MIFEHYEAFKTFYEAGENMPTVFDAVRIDESGTLIRDTYVILWPPVVDLGDDRFLKAQDFDSSQEHDFLVRVVAPSVSLAAKAADRVIARMVGAEIVVDGRTVTKISLSEQTRINADTAVRPPLFFADYTFHLRSDRA